MFSLTILSLIIRTTRTGKHRATIRQAPVGNGLPRAVQTVFGLHLSCRLLMPVLH
ncbi:MAG: hypothetical protein QOG58_4622, partial [Caballeronia sp.]|nr:hypothetical protein [Caballeronia sp.]